MRRKSLVVLAVLVAALGWWVWSSRRESIPQGVGVAARGEPVLASLELARVAALEVEGPGQRNRLRATEQGWVVETAHDYPADHTRLAREMRRLADLEIGDIVQGGASMLAEFGLDPDAPGTRYPTVVRFMDEEGAPLAKLAIGRARSTGDGRFGGRSAGTYVRANEGPVVLVSDSLAGFPRETRAWLSTRILDVQESWIRSITVADGETTRVLTRGEDDTWRLDGLDEQTEKVDSGKADRLARAPGFLHFTTLPPQTLAGAESGIDGPPRVLYAFNNGVQLAVFVGAESAESSDRYFKVSARRARPAGDDAAVGDAESDGPDFAALERAAGWIYLISSSSAEPFLIDPADLAVPLEPEDGEIPSET